jgi:hypothetical protein
MRFIPLLFCGLGLFVFFRTPGAEAVRSVQILLLFAAGMCAGVTLALFRTART